MRVCYSSNAMQNMFHSAGKDFEQTSIMPFRRAPGSRRENGQRYFDTASRKPHQNLEICVGKMSSISLFRSTYRISRSSSKLSLRKASSKVFANAAEAVKDIKNGSTLVVGGFGLCGIPENLIAAVKQAGPK